MGNNTLSYEVRERISDRYSVEELVEYLNLSLEDILDTFEDKVLDIIEDLGVQ